jgi:hypothetical protein
MISLPTLVKPPPCEFNPHLLPDEADWTTGHALSGADDLLRRGSGLESLLWWSGNSIDSAATRAKACDAIVLKSAAAFVEAGAVKLRPHITGLVAEDRPLRPDTKVEVA